MKYYSPTLNWPKIKRRLDDVELNRVLTRDFGKFTRGLWKKKFLETEFPADYETCDWLLGRRGRPPHYWAYVKHSACHWLVNFNLRLATLVAPKHRWRIVTSDEHSTVWNGVCGKHGLLFDLNFCALQVSPSKAWKLATTGKYDLLLPGQYLQVGRPMR